MRKAIASLLVTTLGLALLIYSATRSLHFIQITLPPDKQILAWFGLAAIEGGLMFWLLQFLYGARGKWQRGIAILMVGIDFIGAVAMFTLDTLLTTGQEGLTIALTEDEIYTAVLALSGIIAINIAATIGSHILEPDNMKTMAAEEANDQIEDAAIKQISDNASILAARLAPRLAADWSQKTEARYLSLIGEQPPVNVIDGKLGDPLPAPTPPKPKGNIVDRFKAAVGSKETQHQFAADTPRVEPVDTHPQKAINSILAAFPGLEDILNRGIRADIWKEQVIYGMTEGNYSDISGSQLVNLLITSAQAPVEGYKWLYDNHPEWKAKADKAMPNRPKVDLGKVKK